MKTFKRLFLAFWLASPASAAGRHMKLAVNPVAKAPLVVPVLAAPSAAQVFGLAALGDLSSALLATPLIQPALSPAPAPEKTALGALGESAELLRSAPAQAQKIQTLDSLYQGPLVPGQRSLAPLVATGEGGAGESVSDASLAAAHRDMLALRDEVWAGRAEPGDFYAKVKASFVSRFGPDYGSKIRAFLDDKAAQGGSRRSAIDFQAMSPADRLAFFEKAPKGAELHVHLTGAIAPEVWLKLADRMDMSFPVKDVAALIAHNGEDAAAYGLDLTREKIAFRDMPPALKKALGRTLVVGRNDKVFDDFLKKWMIIGPMDRPEAYYTMLSYLARQSKRQGVLYLEIIVASGEAVLREAVRAAKQVERETGVVIRLIAYGGWYMSAEQVDKAMEAAGRLSGSGVVGFNMVADEAKFRPLPHYGSFKKLRETMPGLGVTLHAGEQPGTADNMVNDLLLGVQRFGHATQVDEDPIAMALLYSGKTPVEVSLLSNRLTGVMPDLSAHPLARLLAWGVPVILSTDDPGIFKSTLAQEYELAQRQFGLSWEELKEISRNGIRHAFLAPKAKAKLLTKLEKRFKAFEASDLFNRHRTPGR